MYQSFFNFKELPFAIVPNPKFYFLSERHKEALSHVLSGINGGGGIALLTGEVGTGKTMTMRALLARFPSESEVLTLLNPSINELELLQTLCDGFGIDYSEEDSFKRLLSLVTQRLYENDARGVDSVLLVDEAQHLSPEVLEQLRLLTNIETIEHKLLKVILIGQPELQQLLRRNNLRQLAQRITERYHLLPLHDDEVKQYILHRLVCAGKLDPVFEEGCFRVIAKKTNGVPRLINLVCDQALKVGYREGKQLISVDMIRRACRHVLDWQQTDVAVDNGSKRYWPYYVGAAFVASVLALSLRQYITINQVSSVQTAQQKSAQQGTQSQQNLPLAANTQLAPVRHEPLEDAEFAPQSAAALNASLNRPDTQNRVNAQENAPRANSVETFPFTALVEQSQNANSAMKMLYQLWGYAADSEANQCKGELRGEISCYKGRVSLEQLRTINQPAVLVLNGDNGDKWYAVLSAMGEDAHEIVAGRRQQRFLVTEDFIAEHWSGEVMLLWRPPLRESRAIAIGQNNQRVRWLDQHLNQYFGNNMASSSRFGEQIRAKVRDFQQQQGGDVDGIAGPITLMLLDGALSVTPSKLARSTKADKSQRSELDDGKIVLLPRRGSSDLALQLLPEKTVIAKRSAAPANTATPAKAKKTSTPSDPNNDLIALLEAEIEQRRGATGSNNNAQNSSIISQLSNELAHARLGTPASRNSASEKVEQANVALNLAQRVENAASLVAKAPPSDPKIAPLPLGQAYRDVLPLSDVPAALLSRMPPMNFQAHVYASDKKNRWVKVNSRNALEGDQVAKGVTLLGIEPQQVVVQFEGMLISIPALSSW
ncbi:MAG: AAA family ATPase [Enterovibrio sp.]